MSAEDSGSSQLHRRVSEEDFHGQPYQAAVDALRAGPYLDFPSVLSVETLSLCNAACNFCPYPTMERKGESMPDSLIGKIFDDIASIPRRPPFEVQLSRVNEPFLDSRIYDLSFEVERRFPEASQAFFSNATPLNEKNLLRLAGLQRVAYLNLSVNDHRQEEYEAVMRLPFERTLERLAVINRMKAEGALRFQIYLSRVGDGSAADAEFLEWVRVEFPALSALVTQRCDWINTVVTTIGGVPNAGCRQWFQLHFLANGRNAFCCIDANGLHGAASAAEGHVIHDIYNRPVQRSRRMHDMSRRQVGVCSGCTLLP
jgi:hypothetical protein